MGTDWKSANPSGTTRQCNMYVSTRQVLQLLLLLLLGHDNSSSNDFNISLSAVLAAHIWKNRTTLLHELRG